MLSVQIKGVVGPRVKAVCTDHLGALGVEKSDTEKECFHEGWGRGVERGYVGGKGGKTRTVKHLVDERENTRASKWG